MDISGASADIESADGKLYQVKSRKIKGVSTTQLSIIRSWEFDLLVVILFNANGAVAKALEVPVKIAREYGKANSHQNGWVITTTQQFLNEQRSKDITQRISTLNS